MSAFTAEVIGTMMLVLFGNGVVANVVLARTKGNGGGWMLINAGWGVAVFVGAFCANEFSGAHLNPAVSAAMLVAGELSLGSTISYMIAQMIGAMIGAGLVYMFYRQHFVATNDPGAKLACFSTAPEIRNHLQSFFCEVVGTFALVFPIFLMNLNGPRLSQGGTGDQTEFVLGLGSLGYLPVALLVFGIGMSLGGTTGYAINPARDLGPRLMHAILPIHDKGDSDWDYAWVPVAGPLVGGIAAAVLYLVIAAA